MSDHPESCWCYGTGYRAELGVPCRLPHLAPSAQADDGEALREEGRRLASERDNLIAKGVDPAHLLIPLWPSGITDSSPAPDAATSDPADEAGVTAPQDVEQRAGEDTPVTVVCPCSTPGETHDETDHATPSDTPRPGTSHNEANRDTEGVRLTEEERTREGLVDLWRNVAEKGITDGVDYPRIVLSLIAERERLAARLRGADEGGFVMARVDQTILASDPKRKGNCVAACIASLVGVDLDRVPHFIEFGIAYGDSDDVQAVSSSNNWWAMMLGYLAAKGYWPVEIDSLADADADEFVLVAGMSPRGVLHQVIYRGGRLWHDPHPSRAGVLDVREVLAIRPLSGFDHSPTKETPR